MRAKRRVTGLMAAMMFVGAFLFGSLVVTPGSYHDPSFSTYNIAAVASSIAPIATVDTYHDI